MKTTLKGAARIPIRNSVLVVCATALVIGGIAVRPAAAATDPNTVTSCSFTLSSLTVSEADPTKQSVMTYAGTPTVDYQLRSWLVVTSDGSEVSSGISPIFTDLFPSPWTRSYDWSQERDGTTRTWTWYALSDQNQLSGSPLCSITVTYGSAGGSCDNKRGHCDKVDGTRGNTSPSPENGNKVGNRDKPSR